MQFIKDNIEDIIDITMLITTVPALVIFVVVMCSRFI